MNSVHFVQGSSLSPVSPPYSSSPRVISGQKDRIPPMAFPLLDQTMQRCCFDCNFFELDNGIARGHTESDGAAGHTEGECRFNPPVLGPEIERDGETIRLYGEFPLVLGTDWCGRFQPRAV